MIGLVKDLFDASADNRMFLAARFASGDAAEAALDEYRMQIQEQFFPKRGFGNPKMSVCRKVISDYRKARGDLNGIVELMITMLETGTQFTNTYGDIHEPFYNSLLTMLGELCKVLRTKEGAPVYAEFQNRLDDLEHAASGIGWGYSGEVSSMIQDLREFYS